MVTLTVKDLRLLASRELGDQFQPIEEVVASAVHLPRC